MTTTRSIVLFGLSPICVNVTATVRRDAGHRAQIVISGTPEAWTRDVRVVVGCALAAVGICSRGGDFGVEVKVDPPLPPGAAPGGLALAVAVAIAGEFGPLPRAEQHVLIGELSLEGRLRHTRGVLPTLRGLGGCRSPAIVPVENREEAAHAGVPAVMAESLGDVLRFLRGKEKLEDVGPAIIREPSYPVDMADVRGQEEARRALEIAAAGGHPILMLGDPGAGKIVLARRLSTLLPPMTREEQLDVSSILSSAGLLPAATGIAATRPFRAPHHTVSSAGLVVGGVPVRPGEVSLAHHGVLCLDEVTEFSGTTLDLALRALQADEVALSRREACTRFPARALLVAAANLCPCGYGGTPRCTCTRDQRARHRARLDRIAPAVDITVLLQPASEGERHGASSADIRARVTAARARQAERARRLGIAPINAHLSARALETVATPDAMGAGALAAAVQRLGLSSAAQSKVLRVARTIADLESSEMVMGVHIIEALRYAGVKAPDADASSARRPTGAGPAESASSTTAGTSVPQADTVQPVAGGTEPQLSPAKRAWITRRAKQAAAAAQARDAQA